MSAGTSIEWTDATWNPVTGCDHVSTGCDNCYAERIANRFGRPFLGAVECHPERLDMPLRWRKPRRVFVNSVSDLFHPDVPEMFIHDVWATMAAATTHTFQILTKRAQRMEQVVGRMDWPALPNVWLGVSVEDQRYAALRVPFLQAVGRPTSEVEWPRARRPNLGRISGGHIVNLLAITGLSEVSVCHFFDDCSWYRALLASPS